VSSGVKTTFAHLRFFTSRVRAAPRQSAGQKRRGSAFGVRFRYSAAISRPIAGRFRNAAIARDRCREKFRGVLPPAQLRTSRHIFDATSRQACRLGPNLRAPPRDRRVPLGSAALPENA
jgi:hypothetical protein